MNALNILDQVEAAKGKDKQKILKDNNDNIELQKLLNAALNFSKKFHIKKFEIITLERGLFQGNYSMFINILNSLEKRDITGNTALEVVEQFFNRCNDQESKWYSRILKKDLKSGFGINTAIKAGFDIPKFDVQLAKDGKLCKRLDKMLAKGLSASPKLDGYRCIAVIEDGECNLFSRNGEPFNNFPTVQEALVRIYPTGEYIFDGEIMSNDFSKTQQSAFASKRGTTVGDMKYHIFDFIPYDAWVSNTFTISAFIRYGILEKLAETWSEKDKEVLSVVERTIVHTKEEILELERDYIQQGYEGVMVNSDIPYYKGKKSNHMLKFKTMQSMDCVITGLYEGKEKYEDTLGGFEVTQENGVKCKVGSGFTDAERKAIWDDEDLVIGKTVEIKFQDLTNDNVMRFPIFLKYRPDKD